MMYDSPCPLPHSVLPLRWCSRRDRRSTPTNVLLAFLPSPTPLCTAPQAVLKAGQAQYPDSCLLAISLANYMFDVRGMATAGWRQVDAARKLRPNLSFLFSIFVREQVGRGSGVLGFWGSGVLRF